MRSEFGLVVDAPFGIEGLADADVIVVPFWRSPGERPPETLLSALRSAHLRGATIVGLCLGGYVLAYAGLLNHRRASTHRELTDDFRRRFPSVLLDPDALYVEAENLVTSAGMGAAMDCCLHVVQRVYGSNIASRVARHLEIPLRLDGTTAAVRNSVPDGADVARIEDTLEYVLDNLDAPHTVDALAGRACMSRRSFTRHFNKATRMSLGRWLLSKRLQRARCLLETTNHRIESVAHLVGFPSVVSFRRQFRAEFGACPNQWRRSKSAEPGDHVQGRQRLFEALPTWASPQ